MERIDKVNTVYVNAIRPGDGTTYNVYTSIGVYTNVVGNIVRCAIGSDLEYLLKCPTNGIERFCPLSVSERRDFLKYSDNFSS